MVKIAKGLVAFLLILLLGCMAYVHFNQEGLTRKVMAFLRKEITTELTVTDFRIEMFPVFPEVTLDLKGVRLQGKDESAFLDVSSLKVTFSLFSVFSDEIRFGKLTLADGTVSVNRLSDGTLSLDVLRPGEGKGSGSPALDFHKVVLKNVLIRYADPQVDQEYGLDFAEGTISGIYRQDVLELGLEGDIRIEQIRLGDEVFAKDADGSVSGRISLDFGNQFYTFEELAIRAERQQYHIAGTIRQADDHQYIDLDVRQTEGELSSFVSQLPASYRNVLPFRQMHGAFTASGSIRGRMRDTENPHVHFDFKVEDADIQSESEMGVVREVDIDGVFDNGAFRNLHSSLFGLKHIEGKARGQHFDASLSFSDLNDPVLECRFEGALPADFVLDYLKIPEVKKVSGTLHFKGIDIGPMRLSHANLTDISGLKGTCIPEDVRVHFRTEEYAVRSGRFDLAGDTLHVVDADLETRTDRVKFTGWMSGLGDGIQSGDPAYFRYRITAEASRLNLATWVPGLAAAKEEYSVRPVASYAHAPLRLPEGEFLLKAVELRYQDILCDAVEANINTRKNLVQFDAHGHAAGGKLHAWGELQTLQGYNLDLKLSGVDLEIRECFAQCHNFGQSFVKSDHLHGKCNMHLIAKVPWDGERGLQMQKMHVLAGMSVSDGELVGFDMLEQFSTYVHAEDLRHIKFDRLDNFFEVRNGNVYIPVMFVRSNAANLVVSGVHAFDNRILYHLKINAGQVLSAKMKKHDPSLTPLPARQEGTFNVFFTIAGTTDQFEYAIDRRGVESGFAQSEEIRIRIREELRQTFGETIDLIEPPEWETIPQYNLEVEGEDVFLEWKN